MLSKGILLLTLTLSVALAQDRWAFQEDAAHDKKHQNAEDKRPLTGSSTRCLIDEYLYPGDQANDYVCDCKPGHLYVPTQNRCYEAYYRNYCPAGSYLILPKNKVVPKCERNSCGQYGDGYVPFKDACYKLHELGPCHLGELGAYVGVNEVTLAIECRVPANLPSPPTSQATPPTKAPASQRPDLGMRLGEEDDTEIANENTPVYPERACFIGGRRPCAATVNA